MHLSQATPFVGRTEELAAVAGLLAEPTCRLLTLVGPGGIGKTRLALEAASQSLAYRDGVHVVALQPLTAPDQLVSAIASAVNFQFYGGSEAKQQLLAYLRKKQLLLVLDNVEHLLDAVDLVSEILAAAPGVRLLITSRERLNLSSETVYNVMGLAVPDSENTADLLDFSAVTLFMQAARRIRPNFTVENSDLTQVVRICRLVGGMPLAILLAAVWVDMLSLEEIVAEIERGLELFETEMRDLPERHRSMRAILDYSWEQLSAAEQDIFKKLSVFRGGFSLEAAKAVAGASLKTLMGLVNKSFVQVVGNGRYDLHELLRQYGARLLNDVVGEADAMLALHVAYYADFTQRWHQEFQGQNQKAALDAVGSDYENIRLAWNEAIRQARWDDLWKLAYSFQDFSFHLGRLEDGLMAYAQAVTKLDEKRGDDELIAVLLAHQSLLSIALARDFPAYRRAATLMNLITPSKAVTVFSMAVLGFYVAHFDLSEGENLMSRSVALCRERGYTRELAGCLVYQMVAFSNLGVEKDKIKELCEEAFKLVTQLNNTFWLPYVQRQKGNTLVFEEEHEAAKSLFEESYNNFTRQGDRLDACASLNGLGYIARLEGNYNEALRQYRQVLIFYIETNNPYHLAGTLISIAMVLAGQGKVERAAVLAGLLTKEEFPAAHHPMIVAVLEEFKAQLPPDVLAAAVQQSKSLDFDAAIHELAAELDQPTVSSIPQPLSDPLSPRELEVLTLVASGRSNQQIAEALFLSKGTVKWYLSEVYSKLGVNNRVQALALARELNLLP